VERVRSVSLFLFLFCIALLANIATSRAETRVALVIGNARYLNTPALSNPGNDATDIAEALAAVGFNVTLRVDVTKRQFDAALAQFSRDAKKADAALVYYAGHGMQFQGRNYVMPVDAELQDEVSLRYEMTAVDDLKSALQASKGVKILVLDSCRDNPLAEKLARSITLTTRDVPNMLGLARAERTNGMIIVYATQADEVAHDGGGRNSPFSAAFLKEIKEPGLEVGTLFRRVEDEVYAATNGQQSPELSISMVPEYYLNQTETDQAVWARIRATADAATLREFIGRYPNSFYAPDAAARLDLMEQTNKKTDAENAKTAVQKASEDATRLKQRQAERDHVATEAQAREQELSAKLAAAEGERAKLDSELAKERAAQAQVEEQLRTEKERKEAAEAEQARVQALKDQVALLQQQASQARIDAEREAQRAAEAHKASEAADRNATAIASTSPVAIVPEASKSETAVLPLIRVELRRLGCFVGGDVDWGAADLKLGVSKYVHYANLATAPTAPDAALLDDMKKRRDGLCPPECSAHEALVGGRCVAKACGRGEVMTRSGVCIARSPPRAIASAPVAAARPKASGKHCFSFAGAEYCE
jgi:uncharacterized caspase-like protein